MRLIKRDDHTLGNGGASARVIGGHRGSSRVIGTNPETGTNLKTGTWWAPTRELAPGGRQPENWHLAGTNPRTGTLWAPTRELVGSAGLGRYRNSLSPVGANPGTGTWRAPTRELAPCGHEPENWWATPGWGAIEIPCARRAPTRELALCGHQREKWHPVGTNPRTGTSRALRDICVWCSSSMALRFYGRHQNS